MQPAGHVQEIGRCSIDAEVEPARQLPHHGVQRVVAVRLGHGMTAMIVVQIEMSKRRKSQTHSLHRKVVLTERLWAKGQRLDSLRSSPRSCRLEPVSPHHRRQHCCVRLEM